MGQIADDIINGWCCQWCGIYFVEEHGYPVLCEDCYNDLSAKEKEEYSLAIYEEF